jgi:hypothetical protein
MARATEAARAARVRREPPATGQTLEPHRRQPRATGGRNGGRPWPRRGARPRRIDSAINMGSVRAGNGTLSSETASWRTRGDGVGCGTGGSRSLKLIAWQPSSGASRRQLENMSWASHGSASKCPRSISGMSSRAATDAPAGSHIGAGSSGAPAARSGAALAPWAALAPYAELAPKRTKQHADSTGQSHSRNARPLDAPHDPRVIDPRSKER